MNRFKILTGKFVFDFSSQKIRNFGMTTQMKIKKLLLHARKEKEKA